VIIAIVLTQSMIDHKEWRFIFPALPPLVALCGLAAIREIQDIRQNWPSGPPPAVLAAAMLAVWAVLSLTVALAPSYRPLWTYRRDLVEAFALAARQPGLCAVDIAGILWLETPGSAALPRGVPLYVNRFADVPRDRAGYNVAITRERAPVPGYRRISCFEGSANMVGGPESACVWWRDGGCAPGVASPPAINWPPYFTNAEGKPRQDRIQAYLPGER
jgi:hypothetical protein